MRKIIDTPFLERERGFVLMGLMRSSGKGVLIPVLGKNHTGYIIFTPERRMMVVIEGGKAQGSANQLRLRCSSKNHALLDGHVPY